MDSQDDRLTLGEFMKDLNLIKAPKKASPQAAEAPAQEEKETKKDD